MNRIISISVDEIDSTQNLARELIKKEKYKNYDFIIITAKRQTAGRGQKENRWSSEKGGLYLTIVTKTQEKNLKNMGDLSIKTAKIVSDLIQKIYGIKTKIKPPNDIYIHTQDGKRKVSGILIETKPVGDMRWIMVGIGVNFFNPLPEDLKNKAITISSLTHRKNRINPFARKLIERMIKLKDEVFNT